MTQTVSFGRSVATVIAAVASILVSPTVSHCADSPQWRGANRDGKYVETGLLSEWPAEGLKPLWTIAGIGEGYSSVAVADGAVYATGMAADTHRGVLSSFALDGALNWRFDYGEEWSGLQPGARSCPTVNDGRVYVLSGRGLLSSVDAKTGKPIWNVDIAKRFGGAEPARGFAESLLIDGGHVICTPGGKDATVVALNKNTGETVWTTKGLSEQAAYCSPILIERGGRRLVVTMPAQSIVGIDASNGEVVWRQPFDEKETLQNHSVTPAYHDGLLYATSGHGAGGRMYEISADGRSISVKWEDTVLNTLHGGLVFLDGYVYGSSSSHRWVCLRAGDGNVMYRVSGVGLGSIIYADGRFYCYGEKGALALVRARPESFDIASSFKITAGGGEHWAHPVIAGGHLYIRHGDTLSAFDIRATR
ncbi:MAG: PQQ-like beta-propeller repeat protein, partial [Candidatus Hydrogenedentes bacterium]|nr:PQQ-like beta-propeller repeat protein [Candidatus Hydrogenedentota bacterium]